MLLDEKKYAIFCTIQFMLLDEKSSFSVRTLDVQLPEYTVKGRELPGPVRII